MTLVLPVVGVLVLSLVVVAMAQRLMRPGHRSSGMADSLGNFIDVFDPARARADRDLQAQENQGAVIPSPDAGDRPVEVDLVKGVARIRRR